MMRGFLLLWVVVGLLGCSASTPPRHDIAAPVELRAERGYGWWYAAFRFHWPEGEAPAWHRDLMVAHRVVAPLLSRHLREIRLWRIHRRAARDGAGHQFSFIFYATPATARQVYAEIEADPDLAELRRRGIVAAVRLDETARITRPGLADTSDPNWNEMIQITWPAYIMGVSAMWLELVQRLAAEQAVHGLAEADYRRVSAVLDRLWADHARHAFLHHLNAVYGYRPFWDRY